VRNAFDKACPHATDDQKKLFQSALGILVNAPTYQDFQTELALFKSMMYAQHTAPARSSSRKMHCPLAL
jgi:hypothetical protein